MTGETTFTVNIHMGYGFDGTGESVPAMETTADVVRALRRIADRLTVEGASGMFQTIFDDNGNDVGRFKLGVER